MPIYIFINHLLMCYCGVYICTIKTSLDRQVIIKRLARDKVVDVFMFIYSTFMIVLLVALAASPGLNDLGVKVLIVSIFCFLSSTIHMAYRFYVIKQANQLYQQPLIYSENNQNYHQISHNWFIHKKNTKIDLSVIIF